MTPKIATFLCILFILYLFKMEIKREPNVSSAIWIPLIWMVIIGSRSVSLWFLSFSGQSFSGDDANAIAAIQEGQPIDRITYLILEIAGLCILLRRRVFWSQIFKSNKWIFLFFLYCGASLLWSEYPFVSTKRLVKEYGNLIMVLVILSESSPVEAIKTLFKRCIYLLIPLSILLIKYYGDLGRFYSPFGGEFIWAGVATGKNGLGVLCLVCGLFLFWNLLTIWPQRNTSIVKQDIFIHVIFLSITFWLLINIDSVTSLICLTFGISFLIVTTIPFIKKNLNSIGTYLLFFLIVGFVLDILFNISHLIIMSVGRDLTFTGRVELWGVVYKMVPNSLIGTGYSSFWLGERMESLWELYWWHPKQAHNGYLEIYINLGMIGLIFLLALIVSSFRKCISAIKSNLNYGRFRFALLLVILIYNITEATFGGMSILWFIFILITINPPLNIQQLPQKTNP